MSLYNGIDISSYQGRIPWNAFQASSVEFVMLRASYGYGNIEKQTDAYFHANAYGAAMAGLFIGAYHNLFATTPDAAHHEAELFLKVIDGYRLAYPVAVNMEDYVLRFLPSDQVSTAVETWCSDLRAAGYYPVIYASADTVQHKLTNILREKNEIWLAAANKPAACDCRMGLQQYTVSGKIDGINGLYHLNYAYQDYASLIYQKGLNGFTSFRSKNNNSNSSCLQAGSKVRYSGPVYRTSYGWFPQDSVNGTFTLTKMNPRRKTGAKLDNLGWVPMDQLTIL